MILFPNAKINIGLDILRKRPDGYHDIETVMVPVPWCDVLEIVPAQGKESTLTVSGRKVDCPPEKNLVMKAYRALSREVPLPPVDMYLRKIIPDGAGLGGGSADASFALSGLNELFSLGMDQHELARIAATLGADCPFFIYNRPMLATGTGTDLAPVDIDLSGMRIIIAKPQVSVPTAAAYSRIEPSIPQKSLAEIIRLHPSQWTGILKNDFEPSVFPLWPEIEEVKRKFMTAGAIYAFMSGSGSAVYALFGNDILADSVTSMFDDCVTFHANF